MEKLILTILGKAGYDALKTLFTSNRSEIDNAFDSAFDRTQKWYAETYDNRYGAKNERFFDYQTAVDELEKITFFLPDPDVKRISTIKLKWKKSVPVEVVVEFVDHLKMEMAKERTLDAVFKERAQLFSIYRIAEHTTTIADNTGELVKLVKEMASLQKSQLDNSCGIEETAIEPLDWKKVEDAFIRRKLDKVEIKQIGEGKSGPDALALDKVFFEQHVSTRLNVSFRFTGREETSSRYLEKFENRVDLWQSYLWRYLEEHHLAGKLSRNFAVLKEKDEQELILKCLESMANLIPNANHEISAAEFAKAVDATAKKLKKNPVSIVWTLYRFLMETHREPLLSCLTLPCSAIFIGDAGTGKTTAARKICMDMFNRLRSSEDEKHPIPIFARLDSVALHLDTDGPLEDAADSLLKYVCDHWHKDLVCKDDLCVSVLRHTTHPIQFILDGFDEIPSLNVREQLAKTIAHLVGKFHFNIILTSRPAAMDQSILDLLRVKVIDLLSLSGTQIDAFINQFFLIYNGDDIETGKADASAFSSALIDADTAREFAVNPLYLTVMMLMHKKHEVLPHRRVELYQEFVNMLLSQHQAVPVHGKHGLKPAFRVVLPLKKPVEWEETIYLNLLYRIAFSTHEDMDDSVSVTRKRVISAMNDIQLLSQVPGINEMDLAREFIDFCDEKLGILVSRGPYYGFSHRSIQEYFTAIRLKKLEKNGIVKFWKEKALKRPDRWSEVARLLFCLIHGEDFCFPYLERQWPVDIEKTRNAEAIKMIGNALYDLEGFYKNYKGPIYSLYEKVKNSLLHRRDKSHQTPEMFLACSDALGLINEPVIEISDPLMVSLEAVEPFQMGDNENDYEKPVHPVRLSPYRIDKYPVTNKAYAEFIRQGGYTDEKYWVNEDAVFGFDGRAFLKESADTAPTYWDDERFGKIRPLCPVVGISWYGAMAFCQWWTLTYGDEWLYSHGLKGNLATRLPTEAEWEFAARGYDQRKYPWGDDDPIGEVIRANISSSKIGQTTTVGSFPIGRTPDTGLMDMAGNVFEWCFDFYNKNYYEKSPEIDPVNNIKSDSLVRRGGSWFFNHEIARCAYRADFNPGVRGIFLGFRCVRTLK